MAAAAGGVGKRRQEDCVSQPVEPKKAKPCDTFVFDAHKTPLVELFFHLRAHHVQDLTIANLVVTCVTRGIFVQLEKELFRLKKLTLTDCEFRCTENTGLVERCRQLTEVEIRHEGEGAFCLPLDGKRATNMAVAFLRNCPLLRVVHMCHGKVEADRILKAVADHCPSLEQLSICMCGPVTDAPLCELARKCSNLRILCLSSDYDPASQVTDLSLAALGEHCPRLESLDLPVSRFTEEGIVSLIERLQSTLKWFRLDNLDPDKFKGKINDLVAKYNIHIDG
jgi:hypothetical protein